MLTKNIVELALIVTFDDFIVQSSLDMAALEETVRSTLVDSGVDLVSLQVKRFANMIPDDLKTVIWINYEGTTLRPYNEDRFRGMIADFLNGIREVQDQGGIKPEQITIRLIHRRHHG